MLSCLIPDSPISSYAPHAPCVHEVSDVNATDSIPPSNYCYDPARRAPKRTSGRRWHLNIAFKGAQREKEEQRRKKVHSEDPKRAWVDDDNWLPRLKP